MIKKETVLENLENDPKAYCKDGYWFYDGLLNKRNKNILISKAYRIWCDQGDRCNNPKNKFYKNYGEKGFKREWTSKNFIEWYINKLLEKDSWDFPEVSRIKDYGNYSINNCLLQERIDNINEMHINKYAKRNNELIEKILLILKENNVDNEIIKQIKKLEG